MIVGKLVESAALGLKQSDLAKRAGLTQKSIHRIEHGTEFVEALRLINGTWTWTAPGTSDFDWTQFDWNGRYITIVALLLNPYSRGELRFKDGGMEIDPNYLSDQRDLDVLIEGVKMIRKIVKEGYPSVGFEGLEEVMPGEHVKTDQGIGVYVRDNAETYYHPVGTCKV
jgi:choline dehydrogenase-like flavoprotein